MTIKKYILLSLGISIFVLLAIIFFATFPFLSLNHQDIEIPKVSIENDIEEYLRIEESKISNIAPNAKKKIIWNNSDTKEKTEYAFVFLHGVLATGHQHELSVRKIADSLGANLFITRLSGHGVPYEGTKLMKAENLLKDAVEAIEVGSKIGDKVIVMGFSLGGAIMSIVASDQISSEKLDYLILLAPAHSKFTSTYFMIALISFLTGGIEADYAELYGLDNEWNQYWSTKVDREELHELWKIPNLSDQIGFQNNEVPLLLFYNNHDAVVPEEGIKKNYKKWKGPKKIYDLNTTEEGPPNHNLIGIFNPNLDDTFIREINKWIDSIK